MTAKNEMNASSGIMGHLDVFQIIPFKPFNRYNSPYMFPEIHLTFSRDLVEMRYSVTKTEKRLAGPQQELSGWQSPFPRTTQ